MSSECVGVLNLISDLPFQIVKKRERAEGKKHSSDLLAKAVSGANLLAAVLKSEVRRF